MIPRDIRKRVDIRAGTILRVTERGRQVVLEPDDIREAFAAIDKVCGIFTGSGMLDQLMKERKRDRAREGRKARRL